MILVIVAIRMAVQDFSGLESLARHTLPVCDSAGASSSGKFAREQ